jgi:ribosomal protein L11 methyltransferase
LTTTATFTFSEAVARRLANALSDEPEIGANAVDLHEASPGRWEVVAYFAEPDASQREALSGTAAAIIGKPRTEAWAELPETDWVARSQAALPPVRAGRVVVYGSHDRDKIRPNELAIAIEAAQAFGTGHHGTTQGCLLAIQAVAKSRHIVSALDVGTGSGVLAIALARAGAWVVATEIDTIAAVIARDNAKANGVARRVSVVMMPMPPGCLPVTGTDRYDLVVANILMGPLLTLAPAIAQAVAPGGAATLSGLLPEQRVAIVATYRAAGLRLSRWFVLDGWLTVILRRPHKRAHPTLHLRAAARLR